MHSQNFKFIKLWWNYREKKTTFNSVFVDKGEIITTITKQRKYLKQLNWMEFTQVNFLMLNKSEVKIVNKNSKLGIHLISEHLNYLITHTYNLHCIISLTWINSMKISVPWRIQSKFSSQFLVKEFKHFTPCSSPKENLNDASLSLIQFLVIFLFFSNCIVFIPEFCNLGHTTKYLITTIDLYVILNNHNLCSFALLPLPTICETQSDNWLFIGHLIQL